MEESNKNARKKVRPAQRLYVPPAKRNQKTPLATQTDNTNNTTLQESQEEEQRIPLNDIDTINVDDNLMMSNKLPNLVTEVSKLTLNSEDNCKNKQKVIVENVPSKQPDSEVDKEKEEMQRAIVNINRKTRPLIKHVSVKNDILQINPPRNRSPIKLVEVEQWEDLFNEEEENLQKPEDHTAPERYQHSMEGSDEEQIAVNNQLCDLEHVIELYEFPSTFKTQDLMQIYSDINQESMYIKWCDETHALLVLGSLIQAQKALGVRTDLIKSRPMSLASSLAVQVATKSDLKPAMKRPQTCMNTARRMITTALGAKSRISREQQEKEREALRKAKAEKQIQRQNERDAWDGFPRPSTA